MIKTPLAAPAMRHRVQLQRRHELQDERGQITSAWATYAHVWADVNPARGRDFLAAAQQQATFDCMVTIRHRADVQANDRVLWGDKPMEIVGQPIDVRGRGQTLELMCTHGVRAGAAA